MRGQCLLSFSTAELSCWRISFPCLKQTPYFIFEIDAANKHCTLQQHWWLCGLRAGVTRSYLPVTQPFRKTASLPEREGGVRKGSYQQRCRFCGLWTCVVAQFAWARCKLVGLLWAWMGCVLYRVPAFALIGFGLSCTEASRLWNCCLLKLAGIMFCNWLIFPWPNNTLVKRYYQNVVVTNCLNNGECSRKCMMKRTSTNADSKRRLNFFCCTGLELQLQNKFHKSFKARRIRLSKP